jgi:hypothetical protein
MQNAAKETGAAYRPPNPDFVLQMKYYMEKKGH